MATAAVRITSFGEGRFEYHPPSRRGASVADALEGVGVTPEERRLAVNGHPAGPGAAVLEGDEVTVVPRVEGG